MLVQEIEVKPKEILKKNTVHRLFNLWENLEVKYVENYIRGRAKGDDPGSYNTNYDVVIDGELKLSLRRESCFSKLTGASQKNDNHKIWFHNENHKNKQIYVYALQEDIDLKVGEIRQWFKFLKTLGLPFKTKELNNYNLNYSYYNSEDLDFNERITEPASFDKQKVYCMIINYDDYKSLEQIKLLLYLFRFIYEASLYKVIKNVIKYHKTYKGKFDFIETFFFFDNLLKRPSYAHNFNNYIYDNINNENFKEYLDSFDDSIETYRNILLEKIINQFDHYKFKVNYTSSYLGNTYKEYHILKQLMDVDCFKVDYTKSIKWNINNILKDIKNLKYNTFINNIISIDIILGKEDNYRTSDLNDDYDEYDEDEDEDY